MFGQNIDGFQMDELLGKAFLLIKRGQFEEVPPLLELYLQRHRQKLSGKALATIIGQLAVAYSQTGELEKSIKAYREVLPLRKQYQNIQIYALSLANLGNVYNRNMQYKFAENCIKDAIAIYKKEKVSPEQKSIAYQQFSSLLFNTGRLRQALKSVLISLNYGCQVPHSRQFLATSTNASEILRGLNMYETALSFLNDCIDLAKKEGNLIFENMLITEKAKVYFENDRFKEGEALMEKLCDETKKKGDLRTLTEILYSWGMIHKEAGIYPFAILRLGECQEVCKKIGNKALDDHISSIMQELIFKPILDRGFKEKASKTKKELSDLTEAISSEKGIIRLETRIEEISRMTDKITTMDISKDNSVIVFGPMNKALKVWTLNNKREILDHKPGVMLLDLLVKFYENSNNFIVAADITNISNIYDSSLYIILQKFFMTKTIDNQYKIINQTFKRLKTPDQESQILGFNQNGSHLYLMSEAFSKPPKDTTVDKMKKKLKAPMEEITGKLMEQFGFPKSEKSENGTFEKSVDFLFGSQKDYSLESRVKAIYKYETDSGELLNVFQFPDLMITKKFLTFNFDSEQAFFLNENNNLEIRSLNDNKKIKEIKPHSWPISYLSVNKDFKIIAYENKEGDFEIWDMENGTLIEKIDLPGEKVKEIETDLDKKYGKFFSGPFGSIVCKLSDDGKLLAFDGADNQFYIYNIPEKKMIKQFDSPSENHIVYLEFAKNNQKLLISTYKFESYIVSLN